MPRPEQEGGTSAGGADPIMELSPADLETRHAATLDTNRATTAERARLIAAAQDGILTDQDRARYAELEHLSRAGIFRARAYSALLGLARLAAQL